MNNVPFSARAQAPSVNGASGSTWIHKGEFLVLCLNLNVITANKVPWFTHIVRVIPLTTISYYSPLGFAARFHSFVRITPPATQANKGYIISCRACHLCYTGETGRRLGDRFREHLRSVRGNMDLPVAKHFSSTGHDAADMLVSIICAGFAENTGYVCWEGQCGIGPLCWTLSLARICSG